MQKNKIDRRLITIILIVFVQMLGAAMILPILPLFAKSEFNLEPQWITLLNTAFFGAQFVAGPYLGRLSDRIGRVPVLIVSQIGTVFSFLLLGLAPNVAVLFLARTLDGITGGNIIVAQAYIADITPPEKKTQAFGYVMAAFGLGFILGPAIGAVLAASYGPRIPYFMAAAAATIVVLLTVFTLNETVTDEQKEASKSTTREKLDLAHIFNQRSLVLILVIAFSVQMVLGVVQSTLALYAEAVLFVGQPDEAVKLGLGVLFGLIGATQIITQGFLIRIFLPKLGEIGMILVASVMISFGQFMMLSANGIYLAGIAIVFFAMGLGFALPSINSLATTVAGETMKGQILGVVQSSANLGVIVSSSIAGLLFAMSPRFPYAMAFGLAVLMIIPILILRRDLLPILNPAVKPSGD
ncbi:MAG: MFS transporter [Anaerolineae bacterium]